MEDVFEEESCDLEEVMARHQAMEEELEREELRQMELNILPEHENEAEAVVEAVLFTMGGSVTLKQLATALDCDTKEAWQAVQMLKKRYETENRGMQIIELDNSFQMCTRSCFYENLIRVAAAPKKHILTDVMLETLSIIAYKQPVTKMEIEKIRGVKSDHAVNRLIEYGLVFEAGRLDAPGRPALFATTEEFLRRFGVGSTDNLPQINPEQAAEFKQEAEEELQYVNTETDQRRTEDIGGKES